MTKKFGLLLTNTGTPDNVSTKAVRKYLREFLSDKRIVKIPRFIWLPLLYAIILPFRATKSTKLYQRIWTKAGSPMRVLMQSLHHNLQTKIPFPCEIGMNYGNPSIKDALKKLQSEGVDHLIVLPLFPQYSNTSSAASFDVVLSHLLAAPSLPNLTFIRDYKDDPGYIKALARSITQIWTTQGKPDHLLISFHGIPERFVKDGDPYQTHTEITAELLANELQLPADQWTLCYQSTFGYDQWLQPSTHTLLTELPKRAIKHLDVICPGFAVDCLETLEEIAISGTHTFQQAGGTTLRYIPALNDTDTHASLLANIVQTKTPC